MRQEDKYKPTSININKGLKREFDDFKRAGITDLELLTQMMKHCKKTKFEAKRPEWKEEK